MYCTECGNALLDSHKYCRVCGLAVTADLPEAAELAVKSEPSAVDQVTKTANVPQEIDRSYWIGVVIFAGFCVLSLLVGIANGLSLLDIGETALWGFASWFWFKKKIINPIANVAVGTLAIVLISGEILTHHPKPKNQPISPSPFGVSDGLTYTTFVAPDEPGITPEQRGASCREAERLANACLGERFKPTGTYTQFGGIPFHLPTFSPVPSGATMVPDQERCNTAFDWNNYCKEREK